MFSVQLEFWNLITWMNKMIWAAFVLLCLIEGAVIVAFLPGLNLDKRFFFRRIIVDKPELSSRWQFVHQVNSSSFFFRSKFSLKAVFTRTRNAQKASTFYWIRCFSKLLWTETYQRTLGERWEAICPMLKFPGLTMTSANENVAQFEY